MGNVSELLARYTAQSQMGSFFTDKVGIVSVLSFANKQTIDDGVTDATQAIKDAIAYAVSEGSTIVYFPRGIYKITSQISVPKGISLVGVGNPASPVFNTRTHVWDLSNYGSVIAVCFGDGTTSVSNSAIQVTSHCTIEGINFWYAEQSASTTTPSAYPPTIAMKPGGDTEEYNNNIKCVTVRDCVFVNPYIAADFTAPHEMLLLDNIKFTAWHTGIRIDGSTDVNRVINVQSNPNISYRDSWPANSIYDYHIANADTVGLLIGQADQMYLSKTFIYGFDTTLHIKKMDYNIPNGIIFNQCGFEGGRRSLLIDSDFRRVIFNNCVFGNNPNFSPVSCIKIYKTTLETFNEFRMTDCSVFRSLYSALEAYNINGIELVNTHFFTSVYSDPGSVLYALYLDGCETFNAIGCSFFTTSAHANTGYFSINNSNMVILDKCAFQGTTNSGNVGVIDTCSHVRVIIPQFTETASSTIYQNANTDTTITDPISY